MTVLAVAGSLGARSSTAALLGAVVAEAGPHPADVYGALGAVPLFAPDLDRDPPPGPVADWRARLAAADAVLVLTPEYAHGTPGALKNALD